MVHLYLFVLFKVVYIFLTVCQLFYFPLEKKWNQIMKVTFSYGNEVHMAAAYGARPSLLLKEQFPTLSHNIRDHDCRTVVATVFLE